ncbi:hypothetical protein [Kitasatospora phosalacinea]|uniref:Uncharacterized protein n=1 Tax=Kitasatospora phosalacinea TaxID=2065 RepID=A0A9W6PGH7_9ACTN|nr:hypothetical protein [Kitasatospora phosalacinea]GLW55655.1 hypothetical protein Kpho01_36660 [Kitasatospora phosalacinea]
MDPISLGLLAALAGGAGGELGKQSWNALTALIRRPFQHAAAATVSSGEAELVALERDPQNPELAGRLNTALAVRAALEPEFGPELEQWHGRAQSALKGDTLHNVISGGNFTGLTIQGKVEGGTHTHYHGGAQPPSA